jgi:hypothetical protein
MQVIPRMAAMDTAEEEFHSSLATFAGGTRPAASPEHVDDYLSRHHGIVTEEALIHLYRVGSFLISFSDMRLADRVLHSPPPAGADMVLVFARYRHQTGALFSPLRFKVLLGLENIPAHVWSRETAQAVAGSSCLIFDMDPGATHGSDLSSYWAAAWSVHPNLILVEVGCIFLDPEEVIEDRAPRYSFWRATTSTPRGAPICSGFSLRLWKFMISRCCPTLTPTTVVMAQVMTPSVMACRAQS